MDSKCKACGSKDVAFMAKWSSTENEYKCLKCGRSFIAKPRSKPALA